jgi:hypothetical protein
MKSLYTILLVTALALAALPVGAQENTSIAFINSLDAQKSATFSDAVTFMAYIETGSTKGFAGDLALLKKEGIVITEYGEKAPLKRGALAKIIALKAKLKDSLLFNIFHSERYAFRACVAAGIMPANRSEYDTLSGTELIEIMSRLP